MKFKRMIVYTEDQFSSLVLNIIRMYYFVGKFIFPTWHVKRKLDIPSQTYKIICNMIMIPHAWINISRYLKAHIAW